MGREVSYPRIGTANAGDIVVSNISAVYRAICVLPESAEDFLVSNEFTVLRLKPEVKAEGRVDPHYLWSILRSTAVIAEWVSTSSGVGRHRVDWPTLKNQRIPLLPRERQREIGDLCRAAERYEAEVARIRRSAEAALEGLDLEGELAQDRLARAKPPK
jgi:restriction endonuclease S subunit